MHENSPFSSPAVIAKPWGEERWYSGIEVRGESRVRCAAGLEELEELEESVPLSRYLAAHGRGDPVVLLKTLHPTAGSLYLEVHETKCEVYIVAEVDGRLAQGGRMLLGVDAGKRRAAGDRAFRSALLDTARRAEAGQLGVCAVEAFMRSVALLPGDAVTIPPRTPHSLRRGVSVIEFQTPTFERSILAASQPLATQACWDSAAAVASMDLSCQPAVIPAGDAPVAVIAETPAFRVSRCRLRDRATFPVAPWSVGWVVRGRVRLGGARLGPGTAFIAAVETALLGEDDAEVLVAGEDRGES